MLRLSKGKTISLRINEVIYTELKAVSEKEGKRMTDLITELIRQKLANEGVSIVETVKII